MNLRLRTVFLGSHRVFSSSSSLLVYVSEREGWLTGMLADGSEGIVPASFVEDHHGEGDATAVATTQHSA